MPASSRLPRGRRLATSSSIVFASQTVQVTTEANSSPIITDFTTQSAARYMPHGLRSRGNSAVTVTPSWAQEPTNDPSQRPSASEQTLE